VPRDLFGLPLIGENRVIINPFLLILYTTAWRKDRQTNRQTDRRTDGRTDGQTQRCLSLEC